MTFLIDNKVRSLKAFSRFIYPYLQQQVINSMILQFFCLSCCWQYCYMQQVKTQVPYFLVLYKQYNRLTNKTNALFIKLIVRDFSITTKMLKFKPSKKTLQFQTTSVVRSKIVSQKVLKTSVTEAMATIEIVLKFSIP